MLALTRRVGEEIVIGDPANPTGIIRVVEVHGDKVRLSFDFPREMQINRRELAELKAKQGTRRPPGGGPKAPEASASNPKPAPPSSGGSKRAEPDR